MIDFSEYLKKNSKKGRRCLYVGKGPSAKYADKYRKFGDVCVINEASAIVKGEIDYAVVVDLERLEGMRPDWHRINTFFVPDKLVKEGKVHESVPVENIKGFPLEKAVVFPSKFWISDSKMVNIFYYFRNIWSYFRKGKLIFSRTSKIRKYWHSMMDIFNSFKKDKHIFPQTSVVGFNLLILLGYDDFYILGNDGGVGYAEGIPYPKENEKAIKTEKRDRKRKLLEDAIYCLSKIHRFNVKFWSPKDEKPIKIALLCPMRLGSSRLDSKMLKKIGNYSLAERALILMKKVEEKNDNIVALAAIGDKELIDLADKHQVKVLLRSQESLNTDEWAIRHQGWCEELKKQGVDFIIAYNACMPFMPIEEVQRAIDFLNIYKRDFTVVFENKGIIWDEAQQKIHPKQNVWDNTKTNDSYYTFSHTFSTWKPEFYEDFSDFYKNCRFWVVEKNMDYFDIDNEEDLKIAKAYFSTLTNEQKEKLFLI